MSNVRQVIRHPGVNMIAFDARSRALFHFPGRMSGLSCPSSQRVHEQLHHVALPVVWRRFVRKNKQFHAVGARMFSAPTAEFKVGFQECMVAVTIQRLLVRKSPRS